MKDVDQTLIYYNFHCILTTIMFVDNQLFFQTVSGFNKFSYYTTDTYKIPQNAVILMSFQMQMNKSPTLVWGNEFFQKRYSKRSFQ